MALLDLTTLTGNRQLALRQLRAALSPQAEYEVLIGTRNELVGTPWSEWNAGRVHFVVTFPDQIAETMAYKHLQLVAAFMGTDNFDVGRFEEPEDLEDPEGPSTVCCWTFNCSEEDWK